MAAPGLPGQDWQFLHAQWLTLFEMQKKNNIQVVQQ